MDGKIDTYRLATMFGEVIAEGSDMAEVMLAGAVVGYDGMTVMVPPGADVQDTVDGVVADFAAEFGRGPA